ncbi:EF-hand domain-containing protein [Streptomyces sp. NPDC058657]|uniref:EF-hand domain-containing protein n=1 Tax=unclassified Streptomyces TaxID=2593676 RepID=UPI00365ED61E
MIGYAHARTRVRFDMLDVNGNGRLEREDFRLLADRVIASQEEPVDSAKAQQARSAHEQYWRGLLAHADTNGDGVVSFEEYKAAVRDSGALDGFIRPYARAMVNLCDRDDDGRVERADYLAYMAAVGFAPDRAESMFQQLDRAGDGSVSTDAWAEVICRYYGSPTEDAVADELISASS